jgi:murein L,D-transpeptidase YcbB/YkuD
MGLPAETPQGIDYEQQHPEAEKRNKLIGYVPVKPVVPLYIIYNTLWPDENGIMQTWKDCYGYDDVMWNQLKPFTEP